MKTFKTLTHPALLIVSFLLLLISGQHFGGFYLLYLLLGLPKGGLHTLIAVMGIIFLVFAYLKYSRAKKYKIESVINIAGASCLILSLIIFFYNDRTDYNSGTFSQVVPLITFMLFGFLALLFITDNLIGSSPKKPPN